MVDLHYNFIKQYIIDYCFVVDGSDVELIRSLKGKLGEDTDYERLIERARKGDDPYSDYMSIIPTLNEEVGKRLVDQAKYWVGVSNTVAIDEGNCKPWVKQMRTAKQKETWVLDKDKLTTKSTTFDALESFHYALQYFVYHNQ